MNVFVVDTSTISTGSNVGAIAGGVVGSLLAIVILLILVVVILVIILKCGNNDVSSQGIIAERLSARQLILHRISKMCICLSVSVSVHYILCACARGLRPTTC